MKTNAIKIKTMENIGACDCRWPVGDPRQPGFHFCGAQQVLGRPYCSEHVALSYDVAKSRQPARNTPSFAIRRAA